MNSLEIITLTNSELTRFFLLIVLLLAFSHFFGYSFQKYGIPRVIGEITGGILLGPTLLGFLFPDAYSWLFVSPYVECKLLALTYWGGLVLLMFISGFEVQNKIGSGDLKIILAVIAGSTIIPFICGWFITDFYDVSSYMGVKNNHTAFKIIIAISIAVTSIPVISKIFLDLDIINTRFAKIVLSSATVHDVILWVALAIASGLVGAGTISVSRISFSVFITISFFIVAILLMPYFIKLINGLSFNIWIKSSPLGYILLICFIFTVLASFLNVNIVFGALLAGIVIGLLPGNRFEKEKKNIKEISLGFFVPVYFAVVGLKLDLIHHLDVIFLLEFLFFTSAVQILGTLIFVKMFQKDWLSCFNLGIAMNAKGGPGIVLATVAFELGIVNETFFVTLVLVSIITSLVAGCWFRYLLSNKLELLK